MPLIPAQAGIQSASHDARLHPSSRRHGAQSRHPVSPLAALWQRLVSRVRGEERTYEAGSSALAGNVAE